MQFCLPIVLQQLEIVPTGDETVHEELQVGLPGTARAERYGRV